MEIPPRWAILSYVWTVTRAGYQLVITTNVPCHLFMRWSHEYPQKHIVPIPQRGTSLRDDLYFCLVAYHDNEQEEAGDTLVHTFIKEPWEVCETRYFYFWGHVAGESSPSETPTFALHRTKFPGFHIIDELWSFELPVPPFIFWHIYEEWSYTTPDPPDMVRLILEEWSGGVGIV